MQLGDDVGDGITDAGNFLQAILRNQVFQWLCERQEVLRRARIRLGKVWVATAQGRTLPEFSEQVGDLRCGKTWHGGLGCMVWGEKAQKGPWWPANKLKR